MSSSPPERSPCTPIEGEDRAGSGRPEVSDSGRAQVLHTLSRATEYLLDSRIFLGSEVGTGALRESVQLLRRSSRAVFLELKANPSRGASAN